MLKGSLGNISAEETFIPEKKLEFKREQIELVGLILRGIFREMSPFPPK